MSRKELLVKEITYGKGKAEIASVNLKNEIREMLVIITTCVSRRTNSWKNEKCDERINDTIMNIRRLLKTNKKVLLFGDFKCKEVNWEDFERRGSDTTWGAKFLNLTLEILMTQWVKENTRVMTVRKIGLGDDKGSTSRKRIGVCVSCGKM